VTDTNIVEAARRLAAAWQAHDTLTGLPADLFPKSRAQAAAIQTQMANVIGEPVVGWKVAGVPGPMVGRVFESHLYQLPARLPASLSAHSPMVECEMGFELKSDLPPRDHAYSDAEVRHAVSLRFMVEIVGTRFLNGKHLPDDETDRLAIIADNAAGTALCVGPELPGWESLALLEMPVELRIDGARPAPGNPAELRTEPFKIMVWLANELSTRGIGLQAGQFVTTGSANVLQPLNPGSKAVATYGEHGSFTVSMDPT